jgi:hypothetical protein
MAFFSITGCMAPAWPPLELWPGPQCQPTSGAIGSARREVRQLDRLPDQPQNTHGLEAPIGQNTPRRWACPDINPTRAQSHKLKWP